FVGNAVGTSRAVAGYYSLATATPTLLNSETSTLAYVRGIATTPDGHLWLASANGQVSRYPDFQELPDYGEVQLPSVNAINRLRYGAGALWLVGSGGAVLRKPLP